MRGGRVTILAQDVSVQTILREWGRVGNTAIVDADKLPDRRVTLELRNVPEAVALRTLLRTAAGYMAAPRPAGSEGSSRFDRILILATSKPASSGASAARRGVTPGSGPGGFGGPGVVPSARGQAPFAVTGAQQQQLAQLQQLLQQPDGDSQRPQPAGVPPAFGNIPSARPGLPMGNADQRERTASVPTGDFGATPQTSESNVPPISPFPGGR